MFSTSRLAKLGRSLSLRTTPQFFPNSAHLSVLASRGVASANTYGLTSEEIQRVVQGSEEASEWLINHTLVRYRQAWYALNYNHMDYNLQDVIDMFESKLKYQIEQKLKGDTKDIWDIIPSQKYFIQKIAAAEYDSKVGNNHFIGKYYYSSENDEKKGLKNRDLVGHFHQSYKKPFYIPVDISHLFAPDPKPCLLHVYFDPKKSFGEQWSHVGKLKKNPNNFLFEPDSEGWKDYLSTPAAWCTAFTFAGEPQSSIDKSAALETRAMSEELICTERPYRDPIGGENIQGLTVSVCPELDLSLWSFSFVDDPSQMDFFIDNYQLKSLPMSSTIPL